MNKRKYHFDKDWLEEKYYGEGLDLREIAELVGCNNVTVLNAMKRYNIPRRPRGGGPRDPEARFWEKVNVRQPAESVTVAECVTAQARESVVRSHPAPPQVAIHD